MSVIAIKVFLVILTVCFLPAYTLDGVILARVYQEVTDSDIFEDFIHQLLYYCGPDSVLIIDNVSFDWVFFRS